MAVSSSRHDVCVKRFCLIYAQYFFHLVMVTSCWAIVTTAIVAGVLFTIVAVTNISGILYTDHIPSV